MKDEGTLKYDLRLNPGDLICGVGDHETANTGLLFVVTDRQGVNIQEPTGGPLGRVQIRLIHTPPGLQELIGVAGYAAERSRREDPGGVHGRILKFPGYEDAEDFFYRNRLRRVGSWPEGLRDG